MSKSERMMVNIPSLIFGNRWLGNAVVTATSTLRRSQLLSVGRNLKVIVPRAIMTQVLQTQCPRNQIHMHR